MSGEAIFPRLVPRPQTVVLHDGYVTVTDRVVKVDEQQVTRESAPRLADLIKREIDLDLDIVGKSTERACVALDSVDDIRGCTDTSEAYSLSIDSDTITLGASTTVGFYYGAQTLVGLIEDHDGKWVVPACEIRDWPTSQWRGFMLDPARGYIPVERIRRIIDQMARSKLNSLHLHLLDAESCALEFEAYPELTEGLAEEVHDLPWLQSTHQSSSPTYSTEDVRELVRYAAARNVQLIPEIDVPGHATQALSKYPELRCEGEGEPSYWTMCAGSDATYEFIADLVDQLSSQFPADVIHIGGDEWEFDVSWHECDVCQRRMEEEDLATERELYQYFLERVHTIVTEHDRRMMVWNEEIDLSMSPTLPRDILIQFWVVRNEKWGSTEGNSMARFLEEGFDVVNSYTPAAYIDRRTTEQALLGWSPTTRPTVPDGYESQVIGGEMAAWSGWEDDSWREYYRRALPSAIPVFADRVWNGSPVEDDERFEQAVVRHVFGPTIASDFDIYDQLGGIILPVDSDRNERKAHPYKSFGNRPLPEAIGGYESTIEYLEQQLDTGNVRYPDAAAAYIDCLEWLVAVAERESRGMPERLQ